MTSPSAPPPRLVLTRRGRLLRFAAVLLVVLVVVTAGVLGLRRLTATGAPRAAAPVAAETSGSDVAAEPTAPLQPVVESASAPPPSSGDEPADQQIVESGTVGDGTWTIARPAAGAAPVTGSGTVRTYALRVENGIGLDAEETAREVAAVLADDRGWQGLEDVVFQQVADPEQAEFTISVASPPTVDALCLPARTEGRWSCRIGPDVALNSDRWVHRTPTLPDTAEYRAYMVNHEVGHFLGHGHARCGGEGLAAPVMLQQSIDLDGCRPNAWPAHDGSP